MPNFQGVQGTSFVGIYVKFRLCNRPSCFSTKVFLWYVLHGGSFEGASMCIMFGLVRIWRIWRCTARKHGTFFRLERNRVGMYRIHRQGHGINMNSNGDVSVGWFLHILTIWVNPCEGFMARFFDGTIIVPFWFCYSNLTFVLLTKNSIDKCYVLDI